MSLSNDIASPNSLQILLQNAHAVHTVNQENISIIQAHKGHQVITKHKYSIQTKPPLNKKQKSTNQSNNTHPLLILQIYCK